VISAISLHCCVCGIEVVKRLIVIGLINSGRLVYCCGYPPLQVFYMPKKKISKLRTHISMNHLRYKINLHNKTNKPIKLQGYDSIDDSRAILGLKYMLLCKIMLNK